MGISNTIRIRRKNLLKLIKDRFDQSQSNFSDVTGISLSQLGQWLSDENSAHLRNMSERSARKIEQKCALPDGWLDQEHEWPGVSSGFTPLPPKSPLVTIARYDTGGAMGSGTILRDQPGIIERLEVSHEWLEKNVRGFTSARNLCVVTGFGDSMRPMYNPGDPLIVDAGVKTVEFDSVYFFRVGDEGFIKRLQRIPGQGLTAISENSAYRDWVIDKTMDFELFGRVLKVWRSEDF